MTLTVIALVSLLAAGPLSDPAAPRPAGPEAAPIVGSLGRALLPPRMRARVHARTNEV